MPDNSCEHVCVYPTHETETIRFILRYFFLRANMSKSTNMLRTRRKDNNVKPNRRDSRLSRLDRKSSRGMIYENEELRLKTININAEIERGQYDIKKLKRENELLKKEIWCLRDEYEKLDKFVKEKHIDFSSSSSSSSSSNSDSDSCSSCTEESETVENAQNLENLKNLRAEFDHLSIVPEESTENSEQDKIPNLPDHTHNFEIQPDQSYPIYENCRTKSSTLPTIPKNFFSPIKISKSMDESIYPTNDIPPPLLPTLEKNSTDLIVKTDNRSFATQSQSTFSNGGNLDELLNDIESISRDILNISQQPNLSDIERNDPKPYKSELNVVLMPNPMPLIGFEKYRQLNQSFESLRAKSLENLTSSPIIPEHNPFDFGQSCSSNLKNHGSKTNLLDLTSSEQISSENEENLKFQTTKNDTTKSTKSPKLSIRRKVSIHFKGKNKSKKIDTPNPILPDSDLKNPKSPSTESSKTSDQNPKTNSSESKTSPTDKRKTIDKSRKSSSQSPDRGSKHVHVKDEKKHKKHKKAGKNRRVSIDKPHRERSFSICTDRSNIYQYDDSEMERTNSLSSCDTIKTRKMSNISNIPINGKVPWCACWGNGCL